MLVLTRRETEKVVFPTLGISIEVLRVRGNKTRIGIDAPPEIPVLRHELTGRKAIEMTSEGSSTRRQLTDMAHAVRRRLDQAATALNQIHQELDTHGSERTQELLAGLYRDLEALEKEANQAIEWSSAAETKHVLVIDDSEVERKLMAGILELSGLNATTACDGQDALEFLSIHAAPDAVLVDMLMPRCDGPQFVAQVRSNPELAKLPIFAVSGVEPASLGLEFGEHGINGWFPKPLEPAELISVLEQRLTDTLAA